MVEQWSSKSHARVRFLLFLLISNSATNYTLERTTSTFKSLITEKTFFFALYYQLILLTYLNTTQKFSISTYNYIIWIIVLTKFLNSTFCLNQQTSINKIFFNNNSKSNTFFNINNRLNFSITHKFLSSTNKLKKINIISDKHEFNITIYKFLTRLRYIKLPNQSFFYLKNKVNNAKWFHFLIQHINLSKIIFQILIKSSKIRRTPHHAVHYFDVDEFFTFNYLDVYRKTIDFGKNIIFKFKSYRLNKNWKVWLNFPTYFNDQKHVLNKQKLRYNSTSFNKFSVTKTKNPPYLINLFSMTNYKYTTYNVIFKHSLIFKFFTYSKFFFFVLIH